MFHNAEKPQKKHWNIKILGLQNPSVMHPEDM